MTKPSSITFRQYVASYQEAYVQALRLLPFEQLETLYQWLERVRAQGRWVYVCGNGGSLMNAMHMVCDSTKGTVVKGRKRLKMMSLGAETATLTAYANDYSYEDVFSEPALTYMEKGDVLIALSASGNSPNVVKAVRCAKQKGAKTVAILGFGGGKVKSLVDLAIVIPHKNYGHAEDIQMYIFHIISQFQKIALLHKSGR